MNDNSTAMDDSSTPNENTSPLAAVATSERGQASVEYALVLLGAAIVASLLIAWATRTKLIDELLDYVVGLVKGKANG
jgi:Flp pilus assembly pilin Flp